MTRFASVLCLAAVALACAPAARASDAEAGARVFKAQCSACHTIDATKKSIGPTLAGVVGRKSGSVEGFKYSEANKNAGKVWDEPTLDLYLTNPRGVVPGTIMTYAGLKNDTQRADLIAYLATLK
jgi:cytochrome c2